MDMKLSIITITYNSERTLKDTLESVLEQKYRPLQYIIVDGVSTDHTLELIHEYEPRFEKAGIEFSYVSEKDRGISDAFNKGIKRADGDLVGIINSDDKLCSDASSILAKVYSPQIDVYYGQCIVFNDENDTQFLVKPKTDLDRLYKSMGIYHPSTFVRKEVYDRLGTFDVSLRYCMDRELLLKFYHAGAKFLYVQKPLAFYREGGVNQTNYKKNLREGTGISIKYGMNPVKARILQTYKYTRYLMWKVIQNLGLEKIIHKRV